VHDLVNHLVGVSLVFADLLRDQVPPELGADHLGDDPAAAYHDAGRALRAAFDQPGVLEWTYHGPFGAASGAERLQLRIADLLAHGWDLAGATGQPAELPEDLAEQALAFARTQLGQVSSGEPQSGFSSPGERTPRRPPPRYSEAQWRVS
jgi:uncharacterized protein (TIGR03086 family)